MNREQLSLHWTVPWFRCVEMPSPDSATSPEGVIFVNGRPKWREVMVAEADSIGWGSGFLGSHLIDPAVGRWTRSALRVSRLVGAKPPDDQRDRR